MSKRDDRQDLTRLRLLAALDAFSMSAEEVAQEDAKVGINTHNEADRWRAGMRATAARVAREAQPARSTSYAPLSARQVRRPDMETLKSLIRGVFATRRELGLAFRDGKKQSDEDWQSLYDDLVDMGAIVPEEHED